MVDSHQRAIWLTLHWPVKTPISGVYSFQAWQVAKAEVPRFLVQPTFKKTTNICAIIITPKNALSINTRVARALFANASVTTSAPLP